MTAEEELIHLRHENSLLREQVDLQRELIDHQQEQISLLEERSSLQQQHIKALQEQLAKDSHNSHLPPSSDRFVRQPKSLRKRSGKKPGGQEGHHGSTLEMSEHPDEVIPLKVEACQHCFADLEAVASLSIERRQVVDVPPARFITQEYQAECKQCPHCHQLTTAAFPEGVNAPVQYGSRIGAIAVYLLTQQLLPWGRACEVLSDLVGVQMSEGTLAALLARTAGHLRDVEKWIKEALIQAEVLHQDETGLYVKGARWWLHVACTARLTHYAVHPKRGKEALETIGILPWFTGTSIHDGWHSYFSFSCAHALCLVHLLRELTFFSEEQHLMWAADLKELFLLMKEAADQARSLGRTGLFPLEVADWTAQYQRILEEADALHPRAQAPPGTRGRARQSAARNLLDRLRDHQKAVLACLDHLAVPFDNNQAERDIRMVKVQQKVSGSFRSEAGAAAFCRIRSYLSTLRKQGLDVLSALEGALRGHPVLPSFQNT
jgi:transposase